MLLHTINRNTNALNTKTDTEFTEKAGHKQSCVKYGFSTSERAIFAHY